MDEEEREKKKFEELERRIDRIERELHQIGARY